MTDSRFSDDQVDESDPTLRALNGARRYAAGQNPPERRSRRVIRRAQGVPDSESTAGGAESKPAGPLDQPETREVEEPGRPGAFSESRNLTEGSAEPATPTPPGAYAEAGGYLSASARGGRSSVRRRSFVGIGAAIVLTGLVSGTVAAVGTWAAVSGVRSEKVVQAQSPGSIVINNPNEVGPVTAVAAKVLPSVVTLTVSGGPNSSVGGSGSGVVLTESGYVVTNAHVVTMDGSLSNPQIEATTNDGRRYRATVVGIDARVDLAVVKLEGVSGLSPIQFADMKDLNVGDQVVAVGAPLGLDSTVTRGIISNLHRAISVSSSAVPKDQDGLGNSPYFRFWGMPQTQARGRIAVPVLQTDAAINHGNSGGALVDMKGRLVGINVAIASSGSSQGLGGSQNSGSIGLGFALPANLVQRVAGELMEKKVATHGYFGVEARAGFGGANNSYTGALIERVVENSPAAKAGLRKGDLILSVAGVRVSDVVDLAAQASSYPSGQSVQVKYLRDGQIGTATVVLGDQSKGLSQNQSDSGQSSPATPSGGNSSSDGENLFPFWNN